MHKRLGQILYEQQIITTRDLKELLNRHEKEHLRVGELAIQLGFATEAEIVFALEIQIAELLVDNGVITRRQCDDVLQAFKESGIRIGTILIEVEYASEDEVMNAYRYQTVTAPE